MPRQGMIMAVETIEDKGRRLERAVTEARAAREKARNNLLTAFQQFVAADELADQARASFIKFQASLIGDALHDIERLKLPAL